MCGADVYDYRVKGGAAVMIVLLLVLIPFTAGMIYAAGWGEFEFNGHPATPSDRRLALIIFPLMITPFFYLCIAGLFKHFNERIVWAEGQLSWTDWLGRERVRCSESDIIGENRKQLLSGNVCYEIETQQGNIRFLGSMPRAAELRARLAAHLKGDKTSPEQPVQIAREWQAKTAYDFRTSTVLAGGLMPILFMVVVLGVMQSPVEMALLVIVPTGLMAAYGLCRYYLMKVEVKDGVIIFSNFLGKPKRHVPLADLRGVDVQSGEDAFWMRVVLAGGKSFHISGDMRDYREFYAELRRLTGSLEA